ncbi:hypothetical protein TWF481_006497 [Arthrobotrys musiformis]|uniref:Uncharacterized protein n=1 Tax=Arthrobotrys musiformis TaxID=47236 RepID=A0AAV9W8P2_9PEZI
MKFTIVALAAAAAVNAQVVYNETSGTFQCLGDAVDKNFCAGDSLTSNIIIRCNGEQGQPGNCNNNLAGVPPVGVKTSALCWQTSETSGDAACSFDGIVYSNGSSFPIPSPSSSSSTVEPTYGPTTTEEPTSSVYPTLSWSNTTSTYYPPGTTLVTVTGTHTITSCDTTTTVPVPTSIYVPPTNTTSTYTTGLPIPTQSPSGAGTILAKDSLVLGVVALIGFMFL